MSALPIVDFHGTKVITIPADYEGYTVIQAASPRILSLNTDRLRNDLRTLEASEDGAIYERTHDHFTEQTLSGVIYSRLVKFLAPYTITIAPGPDRVLLTGSNNNLVDVANVNAVSIIPQNSAGLQTVASGSGLDPGQDATLTFIRNQLEAIEGGLDHNELMRVILAAAANKLLGADLDEDSNNITIRDLADSKNRITATTDKNGNRTSVTIDPSL